MLVTRTGLCLGLVLIFVHSIVCKSLLDTSEESESNSHENASIEELDDSNSLEESQDITDYPDEGFQGFEDYSTTEAIDLHPNPVSVASSSSSSSSSEEILIPRIPQQAPQKIMLTPKPEQSEIVPEKNPQVKVPKAQGRGFGRSFLAKVFKIGGDNETSNAAEPRPTLVMPKGRRIFSAGSESTTEKDVTTTTTTEEVITTTLKLETSTTEQTEEMATSTTEMTTEEILETTTETTEVPTSAEQMDTEITSPEAESTSQSTAISNEIVANNIESESTATAIVSWPDLEIERDNNPNIGKEHNWPEENEDSGLNEEEIIALEIIKRSISKFFQN